MITQKELKKILKYSPDTGLFTWIFSRRPQDKDGCVAGSKDSHGHIQIRIYGKLYLSHRLAWLYMTGSFPENDVDHVNGIRNDNRWLNLREATRQQNQFNRGVSKANKLGIKGVIYRNGKYEAYSRLNGRQNYLGTFTTAKDASKAYINFTKKKHSNFYKEVEI